MQTPDDLVIESMAKEDALACGNLLYEGFSALFDRFLSPNMTLSPQEWKAKQLKYRIETVTYLQKKAANMQDGVTCKVLRIKSSGEIVGMIVWEDKHHPKFLSSSGKENNPPAPPTFPCEIDANSWATFRYGPDRYKEAALPTEPVAVVSILVVKSSQRNRQLGSVLLNEFLSSIQGRAAFLSSAKRAVPLYKRHGFIITAKGIEEGGVPVPTRAGEEPGSENSWPMVRLATAMNEE